MGTAFYSVQRTCHVPLFAPGLAWFCCFAWQIGVLGGGVSLLAGWSGGKEYAELEWPFDIAIAVVWVCFAIVFFGTIAKRRIKPIYVSNWFYGALIIVIAMLHIVNSLAIPYRYRSPIRYSPAPRTPSRSGGTGTARSAPC